MDATRVRAVDVAVAAVVAAALLAGTVGMGAADGDRAFDALAGALVVVAGGGLALHRRAPLSVLALTTAASAVYSLLDYPGGPIYLTWYAAVFAVSVARGPARAWVPTAMSAAVLLGLALRDSQGVVVALFVSWCAGALLLGGSVRGRRAERAAAEEMARHLVESREEEARRRVAEERLRIARDLHDSVAHSMASISVQAGVGAHVLDERPEEARAALIAIKHASGQVLSELRATLGMLRSSEPAPREPPEGLDRLPSLVDSSRAAGLPVDVVIEGAPRPLPPAVDTVAFRIVQESLTNVIRHAGPARAEVVVRYCDGSVEIDVTDDGRGGAAGNSEGGGHGLAGMRERVVLLGGDLHVGPRRSGGYGVWARIPL